MLARNIYILIIIACVFTSCKRKKPEQQIVQTSQECIEYIFKKDDSLGTVRNHACEKIPLSKTIQQYTSNLNKLDFSGCPKEFSEAFKAHILAWNEMIVVTDKHQELRGEMHDLFDMIEKTEDSVEFKSRLKAIWNTWKPIEKAKNGE